MFSEPGDFEFNLGPAFRWRGTIYYSNGSEHDHTGEGTCPTYYDRSRGPKPYHRTGDEPRLNGVERIRI